MSEFKVIETQEQFDEAIKERLTREREKDNLIKKYEKNESRVKIAMSEGIPYELAGKISGETEEEMKKDAKTLSGFLKKNNPYPDYDPEPSGNKDSKREAMRKMLSNLKGEQ